MFRRLYGWTLGMLLASCAIVGEVGVGQEIPTPSKEHHRLGQMVSKHVFEMHVTPVGGSEALMMTVDYERANEPLVESRWVGTKSKLQEIAR